VVLIPTVVPLPFRSPSQPETGLSIEFIIDNGADLNMSSGWGTPMKCLSPLAAAIEVGNVEAVKYLLDRGTDPADERATVKAIPRHQMLLELVLQAFSQRYPLGIPEFGGGVLLRVFQTGDMVALDICLKARFDVNGFGWDQEYRDVTPLGLAILKMCGGGQMLQSIFKLLDAGGNANVLASLGSDFSSEWEQLPVRETALFLAIETRNLQRWSSSS
jgi:hypothetical protein